MAEPCPERSAAVIDTPHVPALRHTAPRPTGEWICINLSEARHWNVHYFFRHASSATWAVADASINDFLEPESCDDGLLLLDTARSIEIAASGIRVPVYAMSERTSHKSYVSCSIRNLSTIVELLGHNPTIPYEIDAELRGLVETVNPLLERNWR